MGNDLISRDYVTLINQLAEPMSRSAAAKETARCLGVEDILLFIQDSSLDVLLPAPGFPQTLSDGCAWQRLAAQAIQIASSGTMVCGNLRSPFVNRMEKVACQACSDGSVIFLIGGVPRVSEVEQVASLIPLLAKALKAERAVLASEGHSQTIRKAALKSHRLAVALDTARAELQQAVRLRDEFLSIASHELKTPITGMLLGTEMLKLGLYKSNEGFFSQEMIAKLVDQTSHGLEQLNRLVEDMLDISRIQAGKLRLRKERIDLCRLVRSTVERYQSQLQSAGIKTRIEASSSPEVFADPFKIEQVITNFITNAIRYAPNGPLNITISQGGGTAKVIFQDSGPGIPPENHAKVFQRFERLVSANEVSGMGLGLYIVKEIIEAHGGRVVLHSELGKGAAFVMILPSEIMEQRHEA